MIYRSAFFLVTFVCVHSSLVHGEDKIAKRLDKARATYDEKSKAFSSQIREKIDVAKEQAQKAGNKTALNAIEKDEILFAQTGAIPYMVATPELLAKREQIQQSLLTSLSKAVVDYTKAGDRISADSIERELKATNERFAFASRVVGLLDGELRITHLATGLVLGVEEKTNKLLLLPPSDAPTHRWKINKRSDVGPYTIENVKTNLLVNVPHNQKRENLTLILWGNQQGEDNELWNIRGEGSLVQFISKNEMAISVAAFVENSEIVQKTPKMVPDQFWTLEKIEKK